MSTTQRLAQALLFAAASIAPALAAARGDEDDGPDQMPATAAALPAGGTPQRLPEAEDICRAVTLDDNALQAKQGGAVVLAMVDAALEAIDHRQADYRG